MKEISEDCKLQIENELYTEVMLLIEIQYNIEGAININKKDSEKIIFKDKKTAIQMVSEAIERFSEENALDKNAVKNYLIGIIEQREESKPIFKEGYEEAKGIISKEDEDER